MFYNCIKSISFHVTILQKQLTTKWVKLLASIYFVNSHANLKDLLLHSNVVVTSKSLQCAPGLRVFEVTGRNKEKSYGFYFRDVCQVL